MKFAVLLLTLATLKAADLPWYMQETAMTGDGRLTFLRKTWWPRAQSLAEGDSFSVHSSPNATVTRQNGHIVETIEDGPGASKAFVISFKGSGLVDRMIVYIDNDRDGKADEMEIRHYQDGYLRYAWFGENYDHDGLQIFDLKDWSYAGNNANNKFRGNLQIYLNKYDAKTRSWVPLSECPFAFWDYDNDGRGDTVLRVSAAPLGSLTGPDADYANNYNYMWSAETTPLAEMGNLNVRLSFNIDPAPRRDPLNKPHYNFGFTSVGSAPYRYPNMTYTNPRRRPPQTVTRIGWKQGVDVGMNYPARETGFTWDESRSVWRWEGEFWIYERVYLSNTGGPTQRWNMRREYAPKPSSKRALYYSEADRRYHLQGASQGWLEAGYLVNQQKDLEFRWFDQDGDGRLDTVEVFRPDNPVPVRVSHFDPRAAAVALNRDTLIRDYNQRILPQAIEADQRFLAALTKVAQDPLADAYVKEAGNTEMPERRRYCLDIARELLFLKVRDLLWTRNASGPYPLASLDRSKYKSIEPGSLQTGYSMGDTLRYWQMARGIEEFIDNYAAGRLEEAASALERIEAK
ncbi:MAG TPA: hypothetical protein VGL72_32885 [Bryobacteraceae bacterium]|jgi:hypothetical protein